MWLVVMLNMNGTVHYCTDLLIFNQIILVITVVLMYNKRNGGDSYGKTKKVQYPSYGK